MSDTSLAEIHHPSRPVIGVVGLGAMGGQIASRLLSQGRPVYGTNRTKAKADPLIDRGLRWRRHTPAMLTARGPLPSIAVDDELPDTARAHGYQHRDITVLYQVLYDLTPGPAGGPNLGFATA